MSSLLVPAPTEPFTAPDTVLEGVSWADAVADDPVTDQPTRCGSAPSLALSAWGRPPRCRVRVRGELDLATASTLVTLLDGLREAGVCYLDLDLRELEFLSAAGLEVLVRADRQFRADRGRLMLTHPTGHTRRLLQLTGLDSALTMTSPRGTPSA